METLSRHRYLCCVDPDSQKLFELEIEQSRTSRILERLDERTYFCEWDSQFHSFFVQHRFPVHQIEELSDTDMESVVAAELDFERVLLGERRFAFQISANRRMPWSFGELITPWMERLGLPLEQRDNRRPDMVFSAYLHSADHACKLYFGTSTPQQNLSPWSQGICRIPRDKDAVSRAEQKLREALELIDVSVQSTMSALDLGSAPGGWTRVLAGLGLSVDAVDPARMDPRVSALSRVIHHQTTAGDFLAQTSSLYDVLVCDMKMSAVMAAQLVVDSAPRLESNAVVIVTFKLPKGLGALREAEQGLKVMKRAYTIVQARQLYFNRHEVTVIATLARRD